MVEDLMLEDNPNVLCLGHAPNAEFCIPYHKDK